jgi:hypothetical protein
LEFVTLGLAPEGLVPVEHVERGEDHVAVGLRIGPVAIGVDQADRDIRRGRPAQIAGDAILAVAQAGTLEALVDGE